MGTLGIAGIVAGLAALPLLRPPLPGNLGPADIALVGGVAAALVSLAVARRPVRFPYAVPVSLMVIAGCLAALGGAYPGKGLLAVVQDLYLLLWAVAVANVASSTSSARTVVRAWCGTAAVWSAVMFVLMGRQLLAAGPSAGRISVTSDTNGAGLYFVLSIFVMLAAKWPRRRMYRIPVIALLLADTLITGSLGALSGLASGVAVALVVGVAVHRGPAPALALLLALCFGTASLLLLAERYNVSAAAHASSNTIIHNSLGRQAQSVDERKMLTEETGALARTTNFLGRGPNSTEDVLSAEQAPYIKQAHNDWIATFIERGVLGVLGLLLLAAEIGRHARRVVGGTTGAVAAVVPAAQYLVGALAVVVIFSLTHEVLHDRGAWTLLGVLAACHFNAVSRRRSGGSREGECVHL